MLYRTLRASALIALRWYYSEVIVQGHERVPRDGPTLIVANHPNALVDAMLVTTSVRRQVLITAKATLFEHPLLAPFLTAVGVVPLRRAKDERGRANDDPAASRNVDAFRRVTDTLRGGRAVLVFPEGISHDEARLAPLKSGAARMAIQARVAGARGLQILPVGLVYEAKESPRSRVLVRIGTPVDLDEAFLADPQLNALAITREINSRLRQVTFNFASPARAEQAIRLTRALTAITNDPMSLGDTSSFAAEAQVAVRVTAATEALEGAPRHLSAAADDLSARVEQLEARLTERGLFLADVKISLGLGHALRFVVREAAIVAIALPIALVGNVAHFVPLRFARAVAMRSVANDPSRDQPAMRTMVLGVAAVLLWYALLALLVSRWVGGWAAVLVLLPVYLAAQVDLLLRDRLTKALRRARAYRVFRNDPALRTEVLRELEGLLTEAVSLEKALTHGTRQANEV